MFRVVETAIIPQPLAKVFDTAADPDLQLKWDPGTSLSIKKVSAGPLEKGARYRANFKGFGNVEYEFVEYEPRKRFAHLAKVRVGKMRHEMVFEPVADGTRLTQTGELLEPNLLGRVMGPMIKRQLRRRFRTIVDELSQYLAGGKA